MKPECEQIARLFRREVPEIAAGQVIIEAIARKPGDRSKLALRSLDPHIDAISSSVGVRGCQIKKIAEELDGERIDLILWSDKPEQLVTNALQPARIEEVVLFPAEHRALVRVRSGQLSWADESQMLATELTGWLIEIEEIPPSDLDL